MLKKILASVGVGAARVDTQLENATVQAGSALRGRIVVRGGSVPQDVRGIEVRVETRYLQEYDDHKLEHTATLGSWRLPAAMTIQPGETRDLPFEVAVPLATPLTLGGQRVWVRTVLDIEGGADATDADELRVTPSALQQRLFEALEQLGFRLRSARCEASRLGRGVPFVQEIEMKPQGGPYAGRLDEIDVFLFPAPGMLDVVIETDLKARGFAGWLNEAAGMDERRHRVTFTDADANAPAPVWTQRLQQVLSMA